MLHLLMVGHEFRSRTFFFIALFQMRLSLLVFTLSAFLDLVITLFLCRLTLTDLSLINDLLIDSPIIYLPRCKALLV